MFLFVDEYMAFTEGLTCVDIYFVTPLLHLTNNCANNEQGLVHNKSIGVSVI